MKEVAIIGAGASGLTAIKCCLDEGLVPTCFERTDDIGGLWNYTEEVRDEQACVMKSTIINTSKEMMCYSDFPIPEQFPMYLHNKYVKRYFKMYADNFKLVEHIQFNTEVLSVKQAEDFDMNGQWVISTRDKKTKNEVTKTFDAVLVCTGHHACPNKPDFPGLSKFKGKVIHSHDYKTPNEYHDKRVVIIGIGNSGGDAAVELSHVTSQVFLSTRRGSWVFNRIGPNGIPIDIAFTSRFTLAMQRLMPRYVLESLVSSTLNKRFDHAAYSLQPNHSLFAQHPMMNDDLPNRIASGSVRIKTDIKCFTETGVEFTDGTKEENIDAVVLATGYIFGFPFIDESVIDVQDNRIELFKYMFPPDLKKSTICIVGCVQPIGALMPISELQCRLATRVFKGDVTLPSSDNMWGDIRAKEERMRQTYVKSKRHTIQVDWIPFMDELATLNGCKPNLGMLIRRDLHLAMKCILGPCTPYQYRLEGPGKWDGARDAIFTQMDRTLNCLKTRPLGFEPKKSGGLFLLILVVLLAIVYKLFF
ncbi:dimethylaniline monooxygenase [N-oxide-forming] 5-like [Pecten maximus]|uniref:dimethylaniline monooxygenase [N-oxide-forming] 5-like n=1 Tax=Pecten maximus TaxID=6579 RepID=UPI0014587A88|nr:dimethylaniline monooxygenase [N-oxide-forming] 5-like [Pecten maximus]XP_033727995.1 dimethylaniline monooxygenase [N-oxide-forming] 5-like [Pecten maximus]XP_033728004.1 dimethylaniline monooxygenase [N-oxide-forming] 5-like [Pecten maximus]